MAVTITQVVFQVMILALCSTSTSTLETYYMDVLCQNQNIVDMEPEKITSGLLKVTQMSSYRGGMDCFITIRAPPERSVLIKFISMDIHEWFKECDDYVQIFDGNRTSRALTSKLCDDDVPEKLYKSTGREMSVYFKSDNFIQKHGFTLTFTSLHSGPCESSEFGCSNGYCIDSRLKCNGYNNCGDASDMCGLGTGAIVGIVIGLIAIVVIVIVVVYLIRRHQKKEKKRRKKEKRARAAAESYSQNVETGGQIPPPQPAPVPAYPYGQPGGYPAPAPAVYPPPGYGMAENYPGYPPPPGEVPPQNKENIPQ